jgi:hypothetical protein
MYLRILVGLFLSCVFTVASAITVPFTRDLYPGITGAKEEVYRLSIVLKKDGYYSGPLTSEYTDDLAKGVAKFQVKNRISPANGLFGVESRYKANQIVLSWFPKKTTTPAKDTSKDTGTTKKDDTTKVTKPTTGTTPTKKVDPPPAPKKDCTLRSVTIKHGAQAVFYRYPVAPAGATRCPSTKRTCMDGVLDGDLSYRFSSCTIPPRPTTTDISDTSTTQTTNTTTTGTGTTTTGGGTTTNTDITTTHTTTNTNTGTNTTTSTTGCVSGGATYAIGSKIKGCMAPTKHEPSATQCMSLLMPTFQCTAVNTWTCVDSCDRNYY